MAQIETDGQEVLETREWVDSLDYVLSAGGPTRAGRLLQQLARYRCNKDNYRWPVEMLLTRWLVPVQRLS